MVLAWLKRSEISTSLDKFKRQRLCVCVFVYVYTMLMAVILLSSDVSAGLSIKAANHNPIPNPKFEE